MNATTIQAKADVAARIFTRLAKLGASEEKALIAAVRTARVRIPAPECNTAPIAHYRNESVSAQLVSETISDLGKTGELRKFAYRGATFIANATATRDELSRAMQRTFGTYKVDERTTPRGTRKVEDTYKYANFVDFSDATEDPAEVEIADNHKDDGSRTRLEKPAPAPVAWERVPWINTEGFDLEPRNLKPLTPEVINTIRYQDRIGQGPRNAERVANRNKAKWLETNDGQAWLDAQVMISGKHEYTEVNVAGYTVALDHPLPETDDDAFSVAFD